MITIARVKEATESFIKILRFGNSDVQTAKQVSPWGVDSKPVAGKVAVHAKTTNAGDSVILGYIVESTLTDEGETRIYCTDTAGVEKNYIFLRKDGKIELGGNADNLAAFADLKSGFDQLRLDVNTLIGKYNLHTHGIAPNEKQATLSTATIDSAKVVDLLCD